MATAAAFSLICNFVPVSHQIGGAGSGIAAPEVGYQVVSVRHQMVWPLTAAAKADANCASRNRIHAAPGLSLELPEIARTA
jgi:hypothetical protein